MLKIVLFRRPGKLPLPLTEAAIDLMGSISQPGIDFRDSINGCTIITPFGRF